MLRGSWNSAGSPNDADAGDADDFKTLDGQTILFYKSNAVVINLDWIRYAPHGKRSWGPTRALIGEATTQQANDYVKVDKKINLKSLGRA